MRCSWSRELCRDKQWLGRPRTSQCGWMGGWMDGGTWGIFPTIQIFQIRWKDLHLKVKCGFFKIQIFQILFDLDGWMDGAYHGGFLGTFQIFQIFQIGWKDLQNPDFPDFIWFGWMGGYMDGWGNCTSQLKSGKSGFWKIQISLLVVNPFIQYGKSGKPGFSEKLPEFPHPSMHASIYPSIHLSQIY